MTEQALVEFEAEYGVKITKVPLEGDGTIERRVERCVFFCLTLNSFFSGLTATISCSPLNSPALCKPQSQLRVDLRFTQRRRYHRGCPFAGVYCIYASPGSVD
jgi:hypothetical protein